MADDAWQRELDADRQRAVQGGDIGGRGKGGGDVDADLAAYYSGGGGTSPGMPPPPPPGRAGATSGGGGSASADDDLAAYYASGAGTSVSQDPTPAESPATGTGAAAWGAPTAFGGGSSDHVYQEHRYPSDFDDSDPRFGVRFVPVLPQHSRLANKIGRLLYFTSPVDAYFKGTFSPAKESMALFATPTTVWIGDPLDGRIVVSMLIASVRTLFVLGEMGLGFRTTQGADAFVKVHEDRARFVAVFKRLRAASGGEPNIVEGSADRETSYRKEIRYLKQTEWELRLAEDPRTGLALIPVPERNLGHYGPLAPKNLHWFGGCNQVAIGAGNRLSGTRRGCWITPTSIFLSVHTGPKPDGSDIVRCIPIEAIRVLLTGPGCAIGISVGSRPPQPDVVIDFDDELGRRRAVFVLERTFYYRTRSPVASRAVENFNILNLAEDRKFRPALMKMSTVAELAALLRSPA